MVALHCSVGHSQPFVGALQVEIKRAVVPKSGAAFAPLSNAQHSQGSTAAAAAVAAAAAACNDGDVDDDDSDDDLPELREM